MEKHRSHLRISRAVVTYASARSDKVAGLNDRTFLVSPVLISGVSFKEENNIVFRVKSHVVPLQVITGGPGEIIDF